MEHSSDIDLKAGLAVAELAEGGMISGRVDGEDAILVRRGKDYFAVGAACTHYHGPLAKGLIVGDTIRCPLHHACFSLRTGEALYAPALDPIACWRVEVTHNKVFVREKLDSPKGGQRVDCCTVCKDPGLRSHGWRRRGSAGRSGHAASLRLFRSGDNGERG